MVLYLYPPCDDILIKLPAWWDRSDSTAPVRTSREMLGCCMLKLINFCLSESCWSADAQRPQLINKGIIRVNTLQCFLRIGQEPQLGPLGDSMLGRSLLWYTLVNNIIWQFLAHVSILNCIYCPSVTKVLIPSAVPCKNETHHTGYAKDIRLCDFWYLSNWFA